MMSELKTRIHGKANGPDYILVGGYYIPAIELSKDDECLIGRWGRMHRTSLEETNPLLFNCLILIGRLHTYLVDMSERAKERCRILIWDGRYRRHDRGFEVLVAVEVNQGYEQHRQSCRGDYPARDVL